jgi:hypothetical protein
MAWDWPENCRNSPALQVRKRNFSSPKTAIGIKRRGRAGEDRRRDHGASPPVFS